MSALKELNGMEINVWLAQAGKLGSHSEDANVQQATSSQELVARKLIKSDANLSLMPSGIVFNAFAMKDLK